MEVTAERQENSPLVGIVVADKVIVSRTVSSINLGASSPPKCALNSSDTAEFGKGLADIKRAILAGSGTVRCGEWVVCVGSAQNVNLSPTVNVQADLAMLVEATRQLTEKIKADKTLRSLQSYMAAARITFERSPYISLGLNSGLSHRYVPLAGTEGDGVWKREFSDLVAEVGNRLSRPGGRTCFIEGAPGSGKSTILHRIGLSAWDDPSAIGLDRPYLPMLVRFSNLALSKGGSFESRLWDGCSRGDLAIVGEDPEPGFMSAWAEHMGAQWLILLDGFDEIPERARPSMRLWLIDLIETSGHKVVVTTRIANLFGEDVSNARGSACFKVMTLGTSSVYAFSQPILKDRIDLFRAECKAREAEAILTTPLDVTIAAILFAKDGFLPPGRAHLLHRFIKLILEEADYRVRPAENDFELIEPILEDVARKGLIEGTFASLDLDSLRDSICSVIGAREARSLDCISDIRVSRVLDALCSRSGLLRREADTLVWAHGLFGELLAARAYARQVRADAAAALEIVVKLFDLGQTAMFRLLLTIWSQPRSFGLRLGEPGDASAAVRNLLKVESEAGFDQTKSTHPAESAAIKVAFAISEGAKVDEDTADLLASVLCWKNRPLSEVNLCQNIFVGQDDEFIVNAVGRLCRDKSFSARFQKIYDTIMGWRLSVDGDGNRTAAKALAMIGRVDEIIELGRQRILSRSDLESASTDLRDFGSIAAATRVSDAAAAM